MINHITLKDTVPAGETMTKMERLTRFLSALAETDFHTPKYQPMINTNLQVIDPELEEDLVNS